MNARSSARILIVEDERNIALGMIYNLEKRGYAVEAADRGDKGLEIALSKEFDLLILDVMLPALDGFKICARLRAERITTPILMLTARGETENRVKGIRLGADDYLSKPFNLEELLARVESLLRRRQWDRLPDKQVRFDLPGGIEFDPDLLALRNGSKSLELTVMECRLLQLLVSQPGKPVARATILKKVWGLHEDTQTRTLDNFVMRLRQHLAELGGSADWIEAVRGVGYRFSAPQQGAAELE